MTFDEMRAVKAETKPKAVAGVVADAATETLESVQLARGICPLCGGPVKEERKFHKTYFDCTMNLTHFFVREAEFGL